MREMVSDLEEHLKKESVPSSLREEYEEEVEKNRQLESEVEHLQQELFKKQGHREGGPAKGLQAYDGMSQLALKKLLRTLEKEKVEVEWELKEIEWRLDQEASAVSKATEEREAIRDRLAQLKSQSQVGSHQ
ncbi:Coiled-coil domain-containing protein 169 [Geodia barretti]|nr:Coiled-coil domain-containing protein 169 [Geodia barretti]